MAKAIRLQVTQEHIDKGTPKSSDTCPIALALMDRFPDAACAVYGYAFIEGSKWYLSGPAEDFIRQFDSRKSVKPSTFVLRPE